MAAGRAYKPNFIIGGDIVMGDAEIRRATPAQRLKEALDLKGMKPVELSELSGVGKSSISCYLSGKYDPKQKALYHMSKALDVNEMWLAGYDVPMERSEEQKQTDALLEFTKRLKTDKQFKELILRISPLNSKKLKTIESLLDSWESQND